ncbi:hypothetical protein, partial [Brevundimonas naejangsanensis]
FDSRRSHHQWPVLIRRPRDWGLWTAAAPAFPNAGVFCLGGRFLTFRSRAKDFDFNEYMNVDASVQTNLNLMTSFSL